MLSRKTARLIAELLTRTFPKAKYDRSNRRVPAVAVNELHDFLYDNDFVKGRPN